MGGSVAGLDAEGPKDRQPTAERLKCEPASGSHSSTSTPRIAARKYKEPPMYSRMRYPLSSFCLVVLAIFGFLLAGSTSKNIAQGASSAPFTGDGVIRLGGGNWGTLSNTDKYSVMLASSN